VWTTYPVQYLHVGDSHYAVHPADAAEKMCLFEVCLSAHTVGVLDHEYEQSLHQLPIHSALSHNVNFLPLVTQNRKIQFTVAWV